MQQNLQKLYGARGLGGSGKTFTVDALLGVLEPVAGSDMNASSLKDAVNECITTHFSEEIVNYNKDANFINNGTMLDDANFELIKNDNNFLIPTEPPMSVRKILQILGTDIIRKVSEDFHIKMLARRLLSFDKSICFITDIRFQNENNFVTEFNKQQSQEDKVSFLSSIAKLEKSMVPEQGDFKNTISNIFGVSAFSNDLSKYFSNMFHDPQYIVENYSEADIIANKSISLNNNTPYSNSFTDELDAGIFFVLRKSSRDLPDHKSEKFNNDLVLNLNNQADNEQVFSNSISPIEDNPQFKDTLTKILNSLFRSLENDNKISITDDIILPDNEIPVKKLSQLMSDNKHSPLLEALLNFSKLPNSTITSPDTKNEKSRQRA